MNVNVNVTNTKRDTKFLLQLIFVAYFFLRNLPIYDPPGIRRK